MVTPPATSLARSCITTVSAPSGITPPVKMRTRFARRERAVERLARRTNRRRAAASRLAVARQVGEAHGPAVHRGIVVAGHVERRDHVLGEHAAERCAHVHALGRRDGRRGTGGSARAPVAPASSSGRSRRRRRARAASSGRPWRVQSIETAILCRVRSRRLVSRARTPRRSRACRPVAACTASACARSRRAARSSPARCGLRQQRVAVDARVPRARW